MKRNGLPTTTTAEPAGAARGATPGGPSTEITVEGIARSEALEARIRRKVRKLRELYPELARCRVLAVAPNGQRGAADAFFVRLDVLVGGTELVVNREHHEDVAIALREAFRAARRRLREGAGRKGGATLAAPFFYAAGARFPED